MFDIGWSEFVVIAVVALIAIGPKELPGVLRTIGQWMGKARRMAAEFQGQFQEAMREAEMAGTRPDLNRKRRLGGCQKQGVGPRQIAVVARQFRASAAPAEARAPAPC